MSATRERGRRPSGQASRLGDGWGRAAGGLAPVAAGLRDRLATVLDSGRRHPRAALAAIVSALVLVVGIFWLWFQDSPLVSVNRVEVTGLAGPDVSQIRQALTGAAERMTTLDVNMAGLRASVARYPDVHSLTVATQFPHGMVIHVLEQVPVAQVSVNGSATAVSQQGALLKTTAGTARLPTLVLSNSLNGTSVSGSGSLAVLAVLAAAPYRLLTHIQSGQQTAQNGVVLQLRHGPQIRFGDTTELHDKWSAAIAVLGTPSAQGAQYIDVTDPGRPAAGASTSSASAGAGASTGSAASTATTASTASTSSATSGTSSTGSTSSTSGTSGTSGISGTG